MDEDAGETIIPDIASDDDGDDGPRKPRKDNGINRTAPPYVRAVQRFAAYTGELCGSGATILFAVIAILTGLASGLAAFAESAGVKVNRGKPLEGA
jgi:hypothetical protein